MNVHADIPSFSAFVRSEFLYDMDPAFEGKTERCTVFAVSSYKGHYPTFKILLENGSLFDYIPAHAISVGTDKPTTGLTLDELCFGKACPDFSITVNVHSILTGSFADKTCWSPPRNIWTDIERYICTIDWYLDNHNSHLVVLKGGQVAFVPNHKILFERKRTTKLELPSYKKLRQEWKP